MKLSLIVAMSRNGVIGDAGRIPWDRIPEDMANFRKLTMGKPCIMGRKTFESLDCPLDGRKNVVLSRGLNLTQEQYDGPASIIIVRTPYDAIVEAFGAPGEKEAFVIGGAEIYSLFAPLCVEAHVTIISREFEGETKFSCDWMCNGWRVVEARRLRPRVTYHRIVKLGART